MTSYPTFTVFCQRGSQFSKFLLNSLSLCLSSDTIVHLISSPLNAPFGIQCCNDASSACASLVGPSSSLPMGINLPHSLPFTLAELMRFCLVMLCLKSNFMIGWKPITFQWYNNTISDVPCSATAYRALPNITKVCVSFRTSSHTSYRREGA